jgi:beta-N-acetylhexosaminidase
MALGAAYQASNHAQLAWQEGQAIAAEIGSVGFNVNFAPVVDVNSNSRNPVINVRAYGDDPQTVGLLGSQVACGMADAQVIAVFKHFPGHGDTTVDSHVGLPVVNKSRAQAYAIDLAPYQAAIKSGCAPDMVMTAHIQYPALDHSTLSSSKKQATMIVPATLSRTIQHDILRGDLGYEGVTITDALDMKGIADFFEQGDAVIKTFQAGVDIALMPIQFRTASTAQRLPRLIDQVVAAVHTGKLSEKEIDASVRRIVLLKLRRGVTNRNSLDLDTIRYKAHQTIGNPAHKTLENKIAAESITIIKNDNRTLPLSTFDKNIAILMPGQQQVVALRRHFNAHGRTASGQPFQASWADQQAAIARAEVVIVGTLSTAAEPVEKNGDPQKIAPNAHAKQISARQFARYALEYAKRRGKKTIHLTLRAPYDVVHYDDIADASIATYSDYGDNGMLLGASLPLAVDIILGVRPATGKLPVDIPFQHADGSSGEIKYPRGFGLSIGHIQE